MRTIDTHLERGIAIVVLAAGLSVPAASARGDETVQEQEADSRAV